jgi:hypothetical protein
MKKKNKLLSIAAAATMLAAALMYSSCKKEEKTVVPAPPGNEFLTTAIITATNAANASDVVTAKWVDLTPDDLNPPSQIDTLKLKAGATYNIEIGILDETTTPAGDVGADIYERRNYHIFCFNVTGLSSGFSITRTDYDTNNPPLPFGMKDDITTGSVSTGTLEVQLKHQPNLKDGTCDPGSVDFDVTYPVIVY